MWFYTPIAPMVPMVFTLGLQFLFGHKDHPCCTDHVLRLVDHSQQHQEQRGTLHTSGRVPEEVVQHFTAPHPQIILALIRPLCTPELACHDSVGRLTLSVLKVLVQVLPAA